MLGMGKKTAKDRVNSEIQVDLSNRNTFFAWQRNHMANERTFLAWCRTGIALVIFSFVIERFDLVIRELSGSSKFPQIGAELHHTHYLALVTFVLGVLIIILSGWRFFYIRKHINRGETEFSTLLDLFLWGSMLIIALMVFVFFIYLY